jgi:hypothetical protein
VLSVVGDQRSWLFCASQTGLRRAGFSGIQVNSGAPRESLATWLRQVEESRLDHHRRYSEHSSRDECHLTEVGTAIPVPRGLRI